MITTIEQAREIAPDVMILARARYRRMVEAMENAGADEVFTEEGIIGTVLGSSAVAMILPENVEQGLEGSELERTQIT